MENRILTAEEIQAADDLAVEFVPVPEWAGGDETAGVYVRTLPGWERDAFEASFVRDANAPRDLNNFRARLCAVAIVGADKRTRLFDDHQIGALGRKSGVALDRVYTAAERLNAFSKRDIDELVGNSKGGPAADSTSSLPTDTESL